ncbi:MAG: hypothetical protein HQ572_00710, partial [Candidatus Omnitrophica bacterium]|nr:hypothetical protein [Candidatus Omnitrophota bacterium]
MIPWQTKNHKNIWNVVVLIVTTTFIFNSSIPYATASRSLFGTKSHAQRHVIPQTEKNLIDIRQNPSAITIPSSYGQIVESFKGKSDTLVVHIQDAHVNEKAQFNIAEILKILSENYDIQLLCLEGASKRLDTSFYDRFPKTEAKEKINRIFVKEALFTGAEYFKIQNNDLKISAFGAEDRDLYLKHKDTYFSIEPDKKGILTYLFTLESILNKAKKRIYSKPLEELENQAAQYQKKNITLAEYASYLSKSAKSLRIDYSKYSNFYNFVEVSRKEKGVDFKKAEDERSQLIDELSKKLNKQELNKLLRLSMDYRLDKLSAVCFYEYLEELLGKETYKAHLREHDALSSYIDYI